MLTRRQFLAGAAAVAATILFPAAGCRLKLPVSEAGGPTADEPHPSLRIALLSDTHVREGGALAPFATGEKLARALADFQPYRPDLWLFAGDITDGGKPGEYEAFCRIVAHAAHPEQVMAATGNHEFYDPEASDALALQRFTAAFGRAEPYCSMVLNGLHLVMLADERWKSAPKNREWAWLGPAQLDWFADVLRTHSSIPTLVCLHQPLQETVLGSFGGNDFAGCGQVRELWEIVRQNPQVKLWLSGHTHLRLELPGQIVRQHGVVFAALGSTFYQLAPSRLSTAEDGFQQDFVASQSRMLDLWSDRAVLRTRDHAGRAWQQALEIAIPTG